jgi:arylsulfatase A-like enzyme
MGGAHVISGYMLPQKSYSEPYSEENSRKVKDKPYVIFIIIDTLRRDCVSAYGYDIRTPNIDRLAGDGILMTDAVVNCSWTKPSIASMMTSLHPLQHNVLSYQAVINPELPTLARVMQETGYYTVGFHNNPQLNIASNFHLGFNRYEGFYTARHRDPRMPEFSLSEFYFRSILEIARKFGIKVFKPPLLYRPAEETSRTAIEWIKNNRDRKFFMFLHYIDPHNPYYYHPFDGKSESPPGWGASPPTSSDRLKILRDLYRGEVEYNDEALGIFFDYLKRINIYDSSLIMLVSDHGEEFYDHSGWSHGATLYEEQIRELFVLKEPFQNGSGAVDSSLVESIDIAPTLAAYVGGAVPDRWKGRDILKADTIRPTEPGPLDDWSLAITNWLKFTCTSLRSRDEKLTSFIIKMTPQRPSNITICAMIPWRKTICRTIRDSGKE